MADRKHLLKDIVLPYGAAIIIGFGIAAILNNVNHPIMVSGSSMEPTYSNGNLLRRDLDFTIDNITAGDIITFCRDNKKDLLVKRVVALPGQTVSFEDNKLCVDGVPSDVYEYSSDMEQGILESNSIVLNENEFFVVGDNFNHSIDSREFGPVPFESIDGIVVGRFFDK